MSQLLYADTLATIRREALQAFEALEQHQRRADDVTGSMSWKRIKGKAYLYHAYRAGRYRSLGPESDETRREKDRFEAAKLAHRHEGAELAKVARQHAARVRSARLNRFPLLGAQIIRALQAKQLGFFVMGISAQLAGTGSSGMPCPLEGPTGAPNAFEPPAGQELKIVTKLPRGAALALLKTCDKTFRRTTSTPTSFTLTNVSGYRVVLCTPMEDDIPALAAGHHVMVFDSKGAPLRLPIAHASALPTPLPEHDTLGA